MHQRSVANANEQNKNHRGAYKCAIWISTADCLRRDGDLHTHVERKSTNFKLVIKQPSVPTIVSVDTVTTALLKLRPVRVWGIAITATVSTAIPASKNTT